MWSWCGLRPGVYGSTCPRRVYAADDAAFFQLWTAKEALLKCRGGQFGQLREPAEFLTEEGFAMAGFVFSPVQLPEGWTGTLCLAERRA